jgi:stringent starvation protein B
MNSRRPYLIRACYEWIADNDCTPFLLVDAVRDDVQVPSKFIEKGRIILNVGPEAVQDLELGDERIRFSARFDGSAMQVSLPPIAVLGIYARESPEAMGMLFPQVFPEEVSDDGSPAPDEPSGSEGKADKRPSLKVVK